MQKYQVGKELNTTMSINSDNILKTIKVEGENLGYVTEHSELSLIDGPKRNDSVHGGSLGVDKEIAESSRSRIVLDIEKRDKLIYGLADSPPLHITIICGLQVSMPLIKQNIKDIFSH